MVRIRVTPTRKKKPGFAGMPGYVSSPGFDRVRPRKTDEELASEQAKKAMDLHLWQVAADEARAENEQEGEVYKHRISRWIRYRRDADMETEKGRKEKARAFRPRRVYLTDGHPDLTLDRQRKRAWKRMDAITIPKRDEGFWGGLRHITYLERAFVKAQIPTDMQAELAKFISDDKFNLWFRQFKTGFYSYIPWDEFTRGLCTYIMAYET